MNIPKKVMAFREEKASELWRMVDILRRSVGPTVDISSISQAVGQLKDNNYIPILRDGTRDPDCWGYSIENFTLPVTTERHMKPDGITNLELRLNMSVIADYKKWMSFDDPLLELNFNVAVRGIRQGETSNIQCLGFHLDRHIEHAPGNNSEEPHPIYHIQYCVNPFDEEDFNYGSVLHLDTPRLMHYPLDFILGIGFLTSNFFPLVFEELLNDGTYINLYKKYQEGILRPYTHSLANHWPFDSQNVVWKPPTTLCPFLV